MCGCGSCPFNLMQKRREIPRLSLRYACFGPPGQRFGHAGRPDQGGGLDWLRLVRLDCANSWRTRLADRGMWWVITIYTHLFSPVIFESTMSIECGNGSKNIKTGLRQ
jgi:hypothetical protein